MMQETHNDFSQETADVVVIGTGAGGAPLIARLAMAGRKVVALEAGPSFNARSHTPDEPTAQELYWLHERLSGGGTPQAFGGNNSGTGIGGSLLHYGAFLPRMDPRYTARAEKVWIGLSVLRSFNLTWKKWSVSSA